MPKKGLRYGAVDVDLARWLADYMEKYRLNQSEMARRLKVNRGRISDMLAGKMNTSFYLDKAVHLCEGNNWLAFTVYATDEFQKTKLEAMDTREHLSEEEKKTWDEIQDAISRSAREGKLNKLAEYVLLNFEEVKADTQANAQTDPKTVT